MVLSLVTIHMTTCDAIIQQGGKTDLTTLKRVLYYIKMAPVIVPNIAFKTCTLALTFVAFRAFGLIIPLVFVICFMFALNLYLCIYDRERVNELEEICVVQRSAIPVCRRSIPIPPEGQGQYPIPMPILNDGLES